MILFSEGGDGPNECFEGFLKRFLCWFLVLITCGAITQEFLPAYEWICFIPIVCMVIHLITYIETYDKKKKNKKCNYYDEEE